MSVIWIDPFKLQASAGSGNDAFTVALLHCDGADGSTTITNSAAGGSTAFTATGNTQIDTGFAKFDQGLLFDGTGDALSFDGSGTDWTWAGDFAIDFWVYSTSSALESSAQRRIFSLGSGATNLELAIDNSPGGELLLMTGAGAAIVTGTGINVSNSAWHHIAVTRSGSSLRMFFDGTQVGSTATNSVTWVGNATSYFGRYQGSAIGHFVGSLDEIRVSKGDSRWTATFTPPTAAYS